MSHYSERVILARHHVAKGRQIVERQQRMVRKGGANIHYLEKKLGMH